MNFFVYISCALTSFFCAFMLYRAYRLRPTRILLWSAVCFLGLFFNNVILCFDLLVVPDVDLSMSRLLVALIPSCALLYALIWDAV